MATPKPSYISVNADPGWPARADVIYHFYAYHRFAPSSDGLDLINLNDTDIQHYNQTASLTHNLKIEHHLATYLKSKSPTDFKQTFILHVQSYNKTISARQRIYMLGLTAQDLQILDPEQRIGTKNRKLTFASAGMAGDGFRHIVHKHERKEGGEGEEVGVEEAVERCLREFEESEGMKEVVEKLESLEVGGGVDSGV